MKTLKIVSIGFTDWLNSTFTGQMKRLKYNCMDIHNNHFGNTDYYKAVRKMILKK